MNILTTTLLISGAVVFLAVAADLLVGYVKDNKINKKAEVLYKEHRAKWALHVHLPAPKPHGTHRKAGV